jgi:hypothetical protein
MNEPFAAEMVERYRPADDDDPDKPFRDRSVRLENAFQGAGVLTGDLTPECAAVVRTVLDALSAPTGAEDTRSHQERYHDALEEASAGGGAWLDGRAASAFACDAIVTPVVFGEVNPDALEALVAPCAELGGHSPGGCRPGGLGPQPPTERGREALELKPPAQVSSGAARSRPQPTAGLGDQGWYQRSLVLSVQVHTTSWVPLRVE